MAHYYHYILWHIYFISSLHLHICCALHFFTIWNNQPSCGLVLTIFKPWSTPHHLPTFIYLSRILIAPQSLLGGSQPSLVQSLAWILLTLSLSLWWSPLSHSTTLLRLINYDSPVARLICSNAPAYHTLLRTSDAMLAWFLCWPPVAGDGSWWPPVGLAADGSWWVSCKSPIRVTAPTPLVVSSLPSMETRSFWNQDPKRWKIAAWRSGRVARGFRVRFPPLHLYDLRIIGTALLDGPAPVPVEF